MNELEFDKQDREVIAAVNGDPMEPPQILPKMSAEEAMEKIKAARAQQMLMLWIKVCACLLVAALFLAMLLDPAWVPVMAYAGIIIFVVMAAVMVDRFFFRKGKWLK